MKRCLQNFFTIATLLLAGASAFVYASGAATEKTNFPTESRSLATLADGENMGGNSKSACQTKKSGQGFVMVDGKPGPGFDEVGDPIFSPDGLLAYVAKKGQQQFIVVDGKQGPAFDEVGDPTFSPDGKMAYWTHMSPSKTESCGGK